jgi:penicillin amidase
MRWFRFTLSALALAALIYLTANPIGPLVFPAGEFFNPFRGFWQNAEQADDLPEAAVSLPGLKGKVEVVFDERRVPHVFAENDEDLYYVQGYLTARDRLWQMEFQTFASAGRLTELVGRGPDDAVLEMDRMMRRKGLPWAAEKMIARIQNDPYSLMVLESYARGVNQWIAEMAPGDLPIEYKILNYRPEQWTPYKTALLLKYMADMLSGGDDDVENTHMLKVLGPKYFSILYPEVPKKTPPIVPPGTKWDIKPEPVASPKLFPLDSASSPQPQTRPTPKRTPGLGSNNWVVAPSKSANGKALLANDPHLGLNLPAIWHELQLRTPQLNVYGVTIPGAPGVIIGFNDSIAWGVTTGSAGVADYYLVEYQDDKDLAYRTAKGWEPVTIRVETYKLKGGGEFIDSVRFVAQGPVLFDRRFGDQPKPLAYQWMAHEAGNELLTFLNLNRAKNYTDYLEALKTYYCPAQNFAYADAKGNIAMWNNGRFVQYFPDQGKYLKEAANPEHQWKGYVPFEHNPHALNPAQGFLASTNQRPTDETYPYDYTGSYDGYRSRRINQLLGGEPAHTLESMKQYQLDTYYVMAEELTPLLLAEIDSASLNAQQKTVYSFLKSWDYRMNRTSVAATIFEIWWAKTYEALWRDELDAYPDPVMWPNTSTTADILIDSARFVYYKNPTLGLDDTRKSLFNLTFRQTADSLGKISQNPADWAWGKTKTSSFQHLTRVLRPFSRSQIPTDGHRNTLNASSRTWGPSWRQVVSPGSGGPAYGIFPGGQSGNPGSPWYDNTIEDWAEGKYYTLWVMRSPAETTQPVAYRITFTAP